MTKVRMSFHQRQARTCGRSQRTSLFCARRLSFRAPCIAVFLILTILLALAGCAAENVQDTIVADYGRYGANLAGQIAAAWPNRSPGSPQESKTGDYLINQLKALGYKPDVASFTFTDQSGIIRISRNISVTVEGQGFLTEPEEDEPAAKLDRQVIIGAHYDAWFSVEDVRAIETTVVADETSSDVDSGVAEEPKAGDFDGIHDNASGIGALMVLAKLLRQEKLGYDVVLVAFGAGEAVQAGAKAYAADMTDADIRRTDVMYCIDSIYAGDKVYAHAGRNSLLSGLRKDYEKRRKLYEVTDVFYEYELYTNNNYMLYTNQASFDVTLADMPSQYLYREWSLTDSDYLPFDEQGIPIVFFESYNYDGKSLVDLKESSSPFFSTTDGAIRHTFYDSYHFLKKHYSQVDQSLETEEFEPSGAVATGSNVPGEVITDEMGTESEPGDQTTVTTTDSGTAATCTPSPDESSESSLTTETEVKKVVVDLLTKRINNTAFIILEAIRKGIPDTTVKPG